MKPDVYDTVTAKVLALMERHGTDWVRPFSTTGRPTNVASGKAYRGINILLLGWTDQPSSVWGTYKQWAEREKPVRKGERGSQVLYWNFVKREEGGVERVIPFLKTYTVFNAAQCEGYEPEPVEAVDTIAVAEDFFRRIPAHVVTGSKRGAYYSPALDSVHMPSLSDFRSTATSTAQECYYSTLAHELVHWTGHTSRLDRKFGRGEDYAREELIAELGAAMICAIIGISPEPRPDHAQYLNVWMSRLKDHKREFVSAASAAAKAVAHIEAYLEEEERIAA